MGRAKDLMMQEEEQGWGFSDNQISSRCISDPYLKGFIKNSATDSSCSFCRRRPSVPLNDVMEIIGNTVADYYNRAVNEAPYESAEGGYQGVTYDTDEVMEDIVGDISRRDEVLAAIRESFDDDTWVERNMFSLNGVQKYTASWEQFCEAVKHQTRYFFNFDPEEESHDTIPVPHMLDTLRDMVQESGMIRTLPADRLIYRVRSHKKTEHCTTREALGSPPSVNAPSNRMSAAGISVFYGGAYEMATARIEASASAPRAGRSRAQLGSAPGRYRFSIYPNCRRSRASSERLEKSEVPFCSWPSSSGRSQLPWCTMAGSTSTTCRHRS